MWCRSLPGCARVSRMLKWCSPGSTWQRGTECSPQACCTRPFWRRNSSLSSPPATHRKFALHRQIFDMRKNEIKRREQSVKAREVGRGLPQVPKGMF